jgi:hypothetical protein
MEKTEHDPAVDLAIQGRVQNERLGVVIGYLLVASGVLLNNWVLARIVTPDGHIEVPSVRAIIWVVDALLVLFGALIVRHPRYGKVAVLCVTPFLSLTVCSLILFAVLEIFPSLIVYTKLHYAHYYALKSRFIADDELVFRNRPYSRLESRGFKGDQYRDSYGVNVKPIPYIATFDEYGFRNGSMPPSGWEVAVLGDSFVEYGQDDNDTFSERLGVLSGLRVRNLGTGSYGPFHYLTVLKRYGLTPKPRYVLFCFSETNDIADVRDYLRWKNHGGGYGNYNLTGKNFLQRYFMALKDVLYTPLTRILGGIDHSPGYLVTTRVGDSTIKTVFSYKNETRDADELTKMNEWKILKGLLDEFESIAASNNIVPVVLFFPTKAHIYAEYTTTESEANWLTMRDQQIAAKGNVEGALRILCREIGIKLISVSSAFAQAASEGKLLYYQFDTHWNSEGRQLAASVVAEALSQNHD